MQLFRTRLIVLIGMAVFLAACSSTSMSMVAADGRLDLNHYDFDREGMVTLDGDWDLYWNKLLIPADFAGGSQPAPDALYSMPSSWSNVRINGQPLPRDGYLTARLLVVLPPNVHSLALYVPSFNTAYHVWVNGQPLASSGGVGTTAAESWPAGFQQVVKFETQDPQLDIVVQTSSFEGVPGGPIGRFRVGPQLAVTTWDYQQIAIDLFVFGTCAIIGLYYLTLYLLRRKETAFFWFGLFCLVIGFRTLLVGREVIHLVWPDVSWDLSIRLIFFAGQLAASAIVAFVVALYPKDGWRVASRLAVGGGMLIALVILFTPPAVLFGPLSPVYNGLVALAILYAAVVGIRAVRNHRPGALPLLLSAVPLALSIAIEALGSARIIPLYSLAGFGVLGTIAVQTFLLLRNFTLAFAAVEALSSQLERTSRAYYRFVPRELLRLIGKEDIVAVELGDQSERAMTVLFADVRGFTSISERMSPDENFQFINRYLGRVGPIMRKHRGFIDKYQGDGFMALFPDKPEDALQAVIDMRRSLAELNGERQTTGDVPIRIGVGLHLGTLMLGTVGEPERMDGTVIADAVNTASRLESLTKRFAVTTIVSAQTLKAMDEWKVYSIRTLGKIRVKGKADSVTIYEVFDGDPEPVVQGKKATLDEFEVGVNLYQAGKFAEARDQFKRVATINPDDLAALAYAERSGRYAVEGGPEGWDGTETLTEK